MPSIYVKLKNKCETVYLQSIWGTYSHVAWIRTENVELGIIKLTTTEDLIDDTRAILSRLKSEIEFEEVESADPGNSISG